MRKTGKGLGSLVGTASACWCRAWSGHIAVQLAVLLAVLLSSSNALSALNKWGGDVRVRHPESLYQVGTSSDVAEWKLSDNTKDWVPGTLSGRILQPDTAKEIYYLIKDNTAKQIEVHGSMRDTDPDRCFIALDKVAAPGVPYAILDQWRVDKLNQRWSLFDPYGNLFIIKALNALDYENHRNGSDAFGSTFVQNIMEKNGGTDEHEAIIKELDTIRKVGFNALGEIVNVWKSVPGAPAMSLALTEERYLPFIAQVRISALSLEGVGSFQVAGAKCHDAADAEFQAQVEARLSIEGGARTEGIAAFGGRNHWNPRFLTPYRDAKFNVAANPWYIGLGWDEEPAYLRSEDVNEHMGYRILTGAASTARKQRAHSLLRTKYDSIDALNDAWGTKYPDWESLAEDTGASGIDEALSAEPYCRDHGRFRESNAAMKADLDKLAADFWRMYTSKVRAALDNLIAVHKINFGPGYHGWIGDSSEGWDGILSPRYLFQGSVSTDGNTPYVDIVGIGDPMHGPLESPSDPFRFVRADLLSIYEEVGRPYWHESVWITAEADSGVAHTGVVESLSAAVLRDRSADFDTAMDWPNAYQGVGSRIWLLLNGDAPRESWVFHAIRADGASDGQLMVDKEVGPGTHWIWTSPDMTRVGRTGSAYSILASDVIPHVRAGSSTPIYIPLSQEERALVYTNFIDGMANLRAKNGDYVDVGFSHWQFFDFAWRNGFYEHRNFGFSTVKGNLYDGSATIKNGEVQDCGDFVTQVSKKLNGLYDEIIVPGKALSVPSNLRIKN